MQSHEHDVLSYESKSATQNFIDSSGSLWRLEAVPLIPELIAPTFFLLICLAGIVVILASFLVLVLTRQAPDPPKCVLACIIGVLLVTGFVSATKVFVRLARGGNRAILLDVSQESIRMLLPRVHNAEVSIDATSIRSILVKQAGRTITLKRRYALKIDARYFSDEPWANLRSCHFTSSDTDIIERLNRTLLAHGYSVGK